MKVNIGDYRKSGTERKIDIKIDNFDTWSLDHTLSLIILPALIQLKHTKKGVPGEFADIVGSNGDSQYSFKFLEETYDDAFQQGCQKWDETLDKMIWSFQQIAFTDTIDRKYHHGAPEYDWEKLENGAGYELIDKNPDEHWYDHVGHQLHYERIQEGLDLFSKFYLSLWD